MLLFLDEHRNGKELVCMYERPILASMILCAALMVGCATSQPSLPKGLTAAEQQTAMAATRAEQAAKRAETAAGKATAAAEQAERAIKRVEALAAQSESDFTQRMRK